MGTLARVESRAYSSAEEALSRERLAPDERAFLVRYFDALRARLRRTEGGR